MASKQSKGKKPAPAPSAVVKGKTSKKKAKNVKDWKTQHPHLFQKTPRVFRIGRDVPPKRDLSRFVRWPAYIRLQRQRAILKQRLKVPPAVHQFSKTVGGSQAKELFKLLKSYRPENAVDKKKRLASKAEAESKEEGSSKLDKKPVALKYGLKHITELIEQKKAALVVIAHDVEPLELVVWLPALCRKMDVPYCIVKGKARLGHLVYKKTATAVAITEVKKEHQQTLTNLVQTLRVVFNDNVGVRTEWGGGVMGRKFNDRIKKEKARAAATLAAAKK